MKLSTPTPRTVGFPTVRLDWRTGYAGSDDAMKQPAPPNSYKWDSHQWAAKQSLSALGATVSEANVHLEDVLDVQRNALSIVGLSQQCSGDQHQRRS